MDISKNFDSKNLESKWYDYWMKNKYFRSIPNEKTPYTIVIPPPNVTGILHMGHMLNNTIQDILIRKARLEGLNACWIPGTDHASIATEAKVVNKLKSQGITKKDLTRDEFLKSCLGLDRRTWWINIRAIKKAWAVHVIGTELNLL